MSEGNSGESPEEWAIRRVIDKKESEDAVKILSNMVAEDELG